MKDNDYYVISVESRKGGVGKTTAALNLAKLFVDRGYAVLFLDADITGTNVGYSINSPFWKDVINVFKEKDIPENLLEWFERKFMCGSHLPEFTKKVDLGKINIIGSQVFEERKPEKNNKQATKEGLICSPSILFDKLHSFWFIEFLKIICKEFARHSEKASVIIIDNSPGFVGIAPAIHEWLTDMGPKRGKFLTVSSLDEQDIASCCHAVNNIHRTLLNKIETAQIFENMRSNKDSSIGPEYHAFFLRLLEEYEEDKNKNSKIQKELVFYISGQWKKTEYLEKPSGYQNWILNRVPREVKKGLFQYNADAIIGRGDIFSELPMKIWGSYSEGRDVIPQKQQVSFDEYIEYQFLHNITSSTRRYQRRRPRAEKMVHVLFDQFDRIIHLNEKTGLFRENKRFSINQNTMIIKYLKDLQAFTENIIDRLDRFEFSNITRLVRKEWYPMYPIRNLQDTFYSMMLDSKYPPFESFNFEFGDETDLRDKETSFLIEELSRHISSMNMNDHVLHGSSFLLQNSYLTAISFLLGSSSWHEPFYKEIIHGLAVLFKLQMRHLMQLKEKLTLQAFLASDDIKEKEFYEYEDKFFHFFEHSWRQDNYYSLFYKSICQVQVRLIDLQKDTEFLIFVLKEVIATSKEELPLLPYIRPLLEKVIEKKTLTHEQGRKQCAKGFKEASYMEEFQEILAGIIDKWGIDRNGI